MKNKEADLEVHHTKMKEGTMRMFIDETEMKIEEKENPMNETITEKTEEIDEAKILDIPLEPLIIHQDIETGTWIKGWNP